MAITFPLIGAISACARIVVGLFQGRTQGLFESLTSAPVAMVGSALMGAAIGLFASLIGRIDRSPGAPSDGSSFQLDWFGLCGALLGVAIGVFVGYQEGIAPPFVWGFERDAILWWGLVGLFTGAILGAFLGELLAPSGSRESSVGDP